MEVNRGREEVKVSSEKKNAAGEVMNMKEEEGESEVIWEAVNFALEQLNLDSSDESAGHEEELELVTRERQIPKLQSSDSSRGSSTKLKSGANQLNLIKIKRSPMGKPIPKLVPVARFLKQEESKSKPGANHLNLIQV